MRISDWSSDVCSSDLKKLIPESSVEGLPVAIGIVIVFQLACRNALLPFGQALPRLLDHPACPPVGRAPPDHGRCRTGTAEHGIALELPHFATDRTQGAAVDQVLVRSEEHTSELQSLMRIS